MTINRSRILSKSLAIRPPILPCVRDVITTVEPDFDRVSEYKTNIVEWLKPVVNLTGFYVYPMNGITEGLNWWSGNSEYNIWRDQADYQWVDNITGRSHPTITYQSIPSAKHGNFVPTASGPTVLDLAYVGSTKVAPIPLHKDVSAVFYSLSKSFGVRNVRTGWYFTRTPDRRLEGLIGSAKYYNYYAHDVAEKIINHFDIDFIHNLLCNYQADVCQQLNLTPSDSVWLATTSDPLYDKFKRGDINRVCIAEEVSATYCSSIAAN
jgi:hypothetical protein